MHRLLLAALAIALLVGASSGVASARFASGGTASEAPKLAPYRAPAAMPRPDTVQPNAWVFRSAESIGARLQRDAGVASSRPAAAPAGSASATVTVTAIVLPVVIIVLDEQSGDVTELTTNTDERAATGVVYLVRRGDASGEPAPLTPEIWGQARAALAQATAGTGTVWSAS